MLKNLKNLLLLAILFLAVLSCDTDNNKESEEPVLEKPLKSISVLYQGFNIPIEVSYDDNKNVTKLNLSSPFINSEINFTHTSATIIAEISSPKSTLKYSKNDKGLIEKININDIENYYYIYNENDELTEFHFSSLNSDSPTTLKWEDGNCIEASAGDIIRTEVKYGNLINYNKINLLTILSSDVAFNNISLSLREYLSSLQPSLFGALMCKNLPIEIISYELDEEVSRVSLAYNLDDDGFIESITMDSGIITISY